VAAKRPSKDAAEAQPKSGLPDFGTPFSVQVGYSRLGCRRPSRLASLAPQGDGSYQSRRNPFTISPGGGFRLLI
jgi:hypothetical protein